MNRSSSVSSFGAGRRLLSLIITLILLAAIYVVFTTGIARLNDTTIIVSRRLYTHFDCFHMQIVTPTHKRAERYADMTRCVQQMFIKPHF